MSDDSEIIREFLVESHENLDQLDREFVALESDPGARERIAAIFRTIHTIKGSAGFLGYRHLEALTHAGETLLSRLRDGKIVLVPETTSELLRMIDVIRGMLNRIEQSGNDGDEAHTALVVRLGELASETSATAASRGAALPVAPPKAAPAQTAQSVMAPPPLASSPQPPSPSRQSPPLAPSPQSPSPAPGTAHPGAEGVSSGVSDASVRVDVGLLDKLMNLVGELVLARNQILQHPGVRADATFQSTTQRLNIITTELQEGVMKTRMQPIGNIWGKFPRVVRDLAVACKKQVRIEMTGENTELDRTIIEAIKDPLTHLVRNSVDHGIELPEVRASRGKPVVGRLSLRAFHEGGQVNIEISDDGGGIDLERVRQNAVQRGLMSIEQVRGLSDREALHLIFAPGFSTAEQVTNLSGRGVGMDVVKTNIEKIGGTVDVQSRPGQGTVIKIKIPLTLAIVPALIVTSAGQRFAIPQVSLLELVRLEGEHVTTQIERLHGVPVYRLRGKLLPLVYLSQALNLPRVLPAESDVANIVVVRADERQFGLVVEGVHDTEEIVVKPLGKELKSISAFAGATIMGDGRVALILDVLGLAQRSGVISEVRDRALSDKRMEAEADREERQALLLFSVSDEGTMAMPLASVARLEEFAPGVVERAGPLWVVQYRGEVLRLIDLREELGGTPPMARPTAPLQVVVYADQGRSVGLIVQAVVDIVQEVVDVLEESTAASTIGVVQGKVTEFPDIRALVEARFPGLLGKRRAA